LSRVSRLARFNGASGISKIDDPFAVSDLPPTSLGEKRTQCTSQWH